MIFTTYKKLTVVFLLGMVRKAHHVHAEIVFSNIEMLLNEELVNEKIKMSFDARVDVTTTCN